MKKPSRDFYQVQRSQWRKSLFLFLVLSAFYLAAMLLLAVVVLFSVGLFVPDTTFPLANRWSTMLWVGLAAAVLVAALHFIDARRFGAQFIRKRLQAQAPDTQDRYHIQFANTVEEMRIASGLPRIIPYVLPFFAVNSMALIERDGTPAVLVTEGLLAEFTRDELQAVVAHELAHIQRGDTFYVTLVCSLGNFFERLRQAAEPEDTPPAAPLGGGQEYQGGQVLVFLAASFSGLLMHLLSMLISREREILADAAAVQFSRNPKALARAIYKAQVSNSFVGDFTLTYAPLFLVPPESQDITDSLLSRIFNSHPPPLKRIRLLAGMISSTPGAIVREVWESRKQRAGAREILDPAEKPMPSEVETAAASEPDDSQLGGNIWRVRDGQGRWQGPFNLLELLALPYFSLRLRTQNLQEDIQATAQEFPQIREGVRCLYSKKHIDPRLKDRCPQCRVPLQDSFYEGVAVKQCPQCRGLLVDAVLVDRIIARREVGFSPELERKAARFEEQFMHNPARTRKLTMATPSRIYCPVCGHKMLPRPYNYQYVLPVDKCLSCHSIWFDPDELEILQILIEKH